MKQSREWFYFVTARVSAYVQGWSTSTKQITRLIITSNMGCITWQRLCMVCPAAVSCSLTIRTWRIVTPCVWPLCRLVGGAPLAVKAAASDVGCCESISFCFLCEIFYIIFSSLLSPSVSPCCHSFSLFSYFLFLPSGLHLLWVSLNIALHSYYNDV